MMVKYKILYSDSREGIKKEIIETHNKEDLIIWLQKQKYMAFLISINVTA